MSSPSSPVTRRVDRAMLLALTVSVVLQSGGLLIVRLNAGCKTDGCLGLGLVALLAMAINVVLGVAGFALLVWMLATGRFVRIRQLGLLALLWLSVIGFFMLHTAR